MGIYYNLCMDSHQAAWLAGLLEGEGYFVFVKNYRHGRPVGVALRPLVGLQMCDEDVVRRAASLMGGSVRERKRDNPRWRISFETSVRGHKAQTLLREIRPYLGERRGMKADELLAIQLSGNPLGGRAVA